MKIKSSCISDITYTSDKEEMVVEFTNGRRYKHLEVEAEVYSELIAAESVGSNYHFRVKGLYPCEIIGER